MDLSNAERPGEHAVPSTIAFETVGSGTAGAPGRLTSVITTIPHLVAGGLVIVVAVLACMASVVAATRVESRYIRGLAPQFFHQKFVGRAIQVQAFLARGLLPVYGSSELNQGEWTHPGQLFRESPTDFAIFPVGVGGSVTINFFENLAGVGDALRGRKVVIILSPQFYFNNLHVHPGGYLRLFSPLQAYELALDGSLSTGFRQAAAQRLLAFPDTLKRDPVLKLLLESLASEGPGGRALYYAVLPVAWLNRLTLRVQDHCYAIITVQDHPEWKARPARRPDTLDWPDLLQRATVEDVASGGPRGGAGKYVQTANEFLTIVHDSDEWTDLDLLLRLLRERGAHPLIFSMPLNAEFFDKRGITRTVRAVLYEKIEAAIAPYDVPFFGFFDHDGDRYFLKDTGGHPSRRGWVYYSEIMDRFYHDRLR